MSLIYYCHVLDLLLPMLLLLLASKLLLPGQVPLDLPTAMSSVKPALPTGPVHSTP